MKTALLIACLALASTSPSLAATRDFAPGLSIGTEEHLQNICAIAIGRDDTLLVAADGQVRFFNPENARCVRSFPTGVTRADALATDGDTIYLFVTRQDTRTITVGNRKLQQRVPAGVTCKRFSWTGAPQPDLTLAATGASAARIANGRLYLADLGSRSIGVYELSSGKRVGTVGRDLRVCCGILDVNLDGGDVLIANLGAFKVQRYNGDGQVTREFGRRGSSDSDFHGCCNPVSVASLPGGNLITVEKDPSRVKLYDANGRLLQVFPQLEQLVEGCQRVSLAVDSKGRVYLGVNSRRHFVLQYVPAGT